MAHIKSIKSDLDKEQEGVWKLYDAGIKLKIARARNPKHEEFIKRELEPYTDEVRQKTLSDEIMNDILLRARATCVLVDWENIEDDDGPVEYSPEKAIEYFKDKELKDLYAFVIVESQKAEDYRQKVKDDGLGNS